MKATIVIPSYWTAPSGKPTDKLLNIYDHPTPITEEGTLPRTLDSLLELEGDFNVCIIGTMTEENFRPQFEEKMAKLLEPYSAKLDLFYFGHSELNEFHRRLDESGLSFNKKYVNLDGYSNIRNLCIILPYLLGSEVAILIDDDEVIEDKKFVIKALDFMGGDFDGQKIIAKTGYYVDDCGRHLKECKYPWWEFFWKKMYLMEEVFKLVKEPPRLKKTPLALGGGMVIHKELFTKVSFDPFITRGEDIDYLVNAKLHGVDFYLDNELYFVHLPPEEIKCRIKGFRQDIYRFYYERKKLMAAFKSAQFEKFSIEELDPYPGKLLRSSVYLKALITAKLLTLRGIFKPEDRGQWENIKVAVWDACSYASKNKTNYFRFQKGWPPFMKIISEGYGDIPASIGSEENGVKVSGEEDEQEMPGQ